MQRGSVALSVIDELKHKFRSLRCFSSLEPPSREIPYSYVSLRKKEVPTDFKSRNKVKKQVWGGIEGSTDLDAHLRTERSHQNQNVTMARGSVIVQKLVEVSDRKLFSLLIITDIY